MLMLTLTLLLIALTLSFLADGRLLPQLLRGPAGDQRGRAAPDGERRREAGAHLRCGAAATGTRVFAGCAHE